MDDDSSHTGSESDSNRRMSSLSRRESSSLYLLRPPSPNLSTTTTSTPFASRSTSPLPAFYPPSAISSSCPSDSDSDASTPYHLSPQQSFRTWRQNQRSWWGASTGRRKRRHGWRVLKWFRRLYRKFVSQPWCSNQPYTIVLILILFSLLAVAITLLIMYILNPDKEPLPWRAYCSVPSLVSPLNRSGSQELPNVYPNTTTGQLLPAFPPPDFDSLPPAGVFVAVFSVDSGFERRQLVRTTWASHPRSREGSGPSDSGFGTSRTIVRFILGQPRKNWEGRVKLEMEMYKDIVVLPIPENMNAGKSHTFFSWCAINAFVPPLLLRITSFDTPPPPLPEFSYVNSTSKPPELAPHDPLLAWADIKSENPKHWVRPDFIVKVDDDSFVMLTELEARLRFQLHLWPKKNRSKEPKVLYSSSTAGDIASTSSLSSTSRPIPSSSTSLDHDPHADAPWSRLPHQRDIDDPLIYWGYLVTNRLHTFMAGEIYALSWSLVDWVSKDETVRTLRWGKEDKQTSKWMRLHPRASEIRWASERCWVYDHPRAATVYSHGFLFPSEVTRIQKKMVAEMEEAKEVVGDANGSTPSSSYSVSGTRSSWAHSSVSTFGVKYNPPLPDLSMKHSVEALVEGSDMSQLREESPMSAEYAWRHREGRLARYEGKRVGGTVAVHFIKKNMWYLETALALLDGDEYSEEEKYAWNRKLEREREEGGGDGDSSSSSI